MNVLLNRRLFTSKFNYFLWWYPSYYGGNWCTFLRGVFDLDFD